MQRLLPLLLVIAVLVPTGAAQAVEPKVRIHREMDRQCRFQWLHDTKWSPYEVRLTLRCAEARWSVDGGMSTVNAIVACESGFDAYADNPYSSAAGVWQVIASTWVSWKNTYHELREAWRLGDWVKNGRANSVLGVRVASYTLSPWNASRHCWGYI